MFGTIITIDNKGLEKNRHINVDLGFVDVFRSPFFASTATTQSRHMFFVISLQSKS